MNRQRLISNDREKHTSTHKEWKQIKSLYILWEVYIFFLCIVVVGDCVFHYRWHDRIHWYIYRWTRKKMEKYKCSNRNKYYKEQFTYNKKNISKLRSEN